MRTVFRLPFFSNYYEVNDFFSTHEENTVSQSFVKYWRNSYFFHNRLSSTIVLALSFAPAYMIDFSSARAFILVFICNSSFLTDFLDLFFKYILKKIFTAQKLHT